MPTLMCPANSSGRFSAARMPMFKILRLRRSRPGRDQMAPHACSVTSSCIGLVKSSAVAKAFSTKSLPATSPRIRSPSSKSSLLFISCPFCKPHELEQISSRRQPLGCDRTLRDQGLIVRVAGRLFARGELVHRRNERRRLVPVAVLHPPFEPETVAQTQLHAPPYHCLHARKGVGICARYLLGKRKRFDLKAVARHGKRDQAEPFRFLAGHPPPGKKIIHRPRLTD